jgi:hypothetical protein
MNRFNKSRARHITGAVRVHGARNGDRRADRGPEGALERNAIAAAKRGEWDGIHYLYARYADEIFSYVLSIVGEHHEAEDITQNVFRELDSEITRYEERSVSFAAWIMRVARGIIVRPAPEEHQPAAAGDAQSSYVDRLMLSGGETLDLAPVTRAGVQPPASVRSTSPELRAMAAIAVAACVQAPLLVASGIEPAVAFPALIALLCLAPAIAFLTPARGRLEVGLMLGIGLAAGAVIIQLTLELGGWWPKALLYVLAVACLPLLLGRLSRMGKPDAPRAR